jgi:hypothetical protein
MAMVKTGRWRAEGGYLLSCWVPCLKAAADQERRTGGGGDSWSRTARARLPDGRQRREAPRLLGERWGEGGASSRVDSVGWIFLDGSLSYWASFCWPIKIR